MTGPVYTSSDLSDLEEDQLDSASDQDQLESDQDELAEQEYNSTRKKEAPKLKIKFSTKARAIPFESVQIPMGDKSATDRFVSWRVNKDSQQVEILVKYKNMCHKNSDWILKSELESNLTMRTRIKKFMDKPVWEIQWSDDEPYNPSFNKIDRLIDEGEANGQVFYLVKWCSLTYDACTWEPSTFVEELDADSIDLFYERREMPDEKVKSVALPGRKSNRVWKKLDESPVYKNENTLRSYQLEGLNWLMFCWANKRNSILADEMGLGKTVQSTAFINELYLNHNIKGPFLVIAPLSTIGNWEREVKTWTDLNVVVYHGNGPARNLIIDTEFHYKDPKGVPIPGIYKFDVILTTYEMAMSGIAHLKPIDWRVVILDEAHRLKNKTSKVSEVLKTYKMEHRVLLTGTPLQNSLDELWALLNFLEPAQFASEQDFKVNYGSLSSAADVEKLQGLLQPLMLRRLKEDVEKTIPVKEETIVEVELTTTQKKWYRSILEKNFSWLKQGSKQKNNLPNLINTMIELRKCCIHPWLLKGAEEQILDELNARDGYSQLEALISSSGKMVLLDKLLRKLKTDGHKVLIFSQMTKCLDLIQDYLRGRNWNFERIDGGVRGDLRQAAIDRFSVPDSDSFVFLLCTRAGGVGINLTAADTCVIFDSDWNPQNDLQAQSRCHRIGQKKTVKIYRFVTRNTYEEEMLNRASMKLGLDKAVLQRMDMQESSGGYDALEPKGPSPLAKHEIEELLKKGAYGAFMDDDASKQFCEEDIEQILERRTQIIRHDRSEAERGSIFSKASFQAATNVAAIDVNDPDFWDKVKEQAKLEVAEAVNPDDMLIIDAPRNRRQTNRFRGESDEEAENDHGVRRQSSSLALIPMGTKPIAWTITERSKLERILMTHGFHQFHKVRDQFPRRSLEDLLVCSRAMIEFCLKHCDVLDPGVRTDVLKAVALFPPRTSRKPKEEDDDYEEDLTVFEEVKEYEGVPPELVPFTEHQLPYPGASPRQKKEFDSFIKEASKEYLDHLGRKAKSLLVRVSLMYHVRNVHKPHPGMTMAKILGGTPVPWWGMDEDRDLLIGVCKHGYQQYAKVWSDPELIFHSKLGAQQMAIDASSKASSVADPNSKPGEDEIDEIDVKEASKASSVADPLSKAGEEDVEPHETSKASSVADPLSKAGEEMDELDQKETRMDEEEDQVDSAQPMEGMTRADMESSAPVISAASGFAFPSPTDLGIRVRRIIGALSRMKDKTTRPASKRQSASTAPVDRPRRLYKREVGLDLTKRQKIEFYRIINLLGVRRDPQDPSRHDWTHFLAGDELCKKSDEALELFFDKLYRGAVTIVERYDDNAKGIVPAVESTEEEPTFGPETDPSVARKETIFAGVDPEIRDLLSYEKARRILRRVDYFYKLREQVLIDPQLDEKLLTIKGHGRHGVPKWWKYSYDKYFLIGCEKYGINRWDQFASDPELPFMEIHQEYLKSLEYRAENNVPPEAIVDGRFEERFWMKDAIGLKRFETLIDLAEKPFYNRPRKPKADDPQYKEKSKKSGKVLKLKFKLEKPNEEEEDFVPRTSSRSTRNSPSKSADPSFENQESASKRPAQGNDSDSGDTDDMIEAVDKRLGSKRSSKKPKTEPVQEYEYPPGYGYHPEMYPSYYPPQMPYGYPQMPNQPGYGYPEPYYPAHHVPQPYYDQEMQPFVEGSRPSEYPPQPHGRSSPPSHPHQEYSASHAHPPHPHAHPAQPQGAQEYHAHPQGQEYPLQGHAHPQGQEYPPQGHAQGGQDYPPQGVSQPHGHAEYPPVQPVAEATYPVQSQSQAHSQ